MPAVHINNSRPDLDGPLSRAFNDVIRNKTTDDKNIRKLLTELNELGLNLVTAVPGESIVIFVYCKTVQSAVKFTRLFNSGRLQHILESSLNRLLLTIEPHNTKELESRISLEDEEVATLEDFTGIEGNKKYSKCTAIVVCNNNYYVVKDGLFETRPTESCIFPWKFS